MYDFSDFEDSFFSCSSSGLSDQDYASAFSDDSTHLHDQLTTTFLNFSNNFNIVHINAQSIHAHYADLLSSFDCKVIDAILVSETFLKPPLPSTQYSLPGYLLIRNDRVGKGYGGVAIYLRADIPYKIVDQSPNVYSNFAEHLFIEVTLHHSKVMLGVYYPPSRNVDYFLSLETKLEDLMLLFDHTIILGDFNTCLLKKDSRSNKLISLVSSNNMHILPLTATHHSPNCTPSLLDLILVSDLDRVASHGQLSASFSYHDLIYLSYKIQRPKRKPKYLSLRNFKNIDLDRLKADASKIDWSCVSALGDIDSKLTAFNKTIIELFDIHAPLRRVRVKYFPAPWLTPSIRRLMSKRDKAKRMYKKYLTEEKLTVFKKLRNRCSKLCRDAKRRHIHKSIEDADSAQMWKFLKSLGVGNSFNDSNVSFDLSALNRHFSYPPISLNDGVKYSTLDFLSNTLKPSCPAFVFREVTQAEIKKCLSSVSTKAVGSDNLCIQMINPISDELVPIITHLINHSLDTGIFPSDWKKAFVIPLPKTSKPASLSEFRPISILPILSKTLENVVQKQLSVYLFSNNLLSTYQSGFRPGHSTVSALIKVSDDIRYAMDNQLLTVLALLDFSSAFNSVDYDILLGILSSLNVSTSAIDWFNSYLRGRSQCVRYDENFSDWSDLTAGVPQGGVLSPLLFSIFINALTPAISSHYHLYADDLQLYRHFKADNIMEAIDLLNLDLRNISNWAKSFGLLVNPSKSQVLLIGSRFMLNVLDHSNLPVVSYDNAPIAYTQTAKNLGVIFDSHLSWSSHINAVSRKVNYSFQSLKRLQMFLPIKTKTTLAKALLLPLLDYADVCYLDATEVLLNKLERLQNLCIRFIFGLRKYDHVSAYRAQLEWLPIRRRRDCHVLTFLYSILFNPRSPPYLCERFVYVVPRGVPCRTSMSLLLRMPAHTSTRYGDSFSVHAVRLWNSIPHDIRASPSIDLFKARLKQYYLLN